MILEDQDDIDVVGEASDGREALSRSRELQPDVVLMDIRMPVMDGIEATKRLVQAQPQIRVVVLTTYDSDRHVYEALRAGASGFLLKTAPPRQLPAAVRDVASGGTMLSPGVTRRLIETFLAQPPAPRTTPEALRSLTSRELEVLRLVAKGLSNKEIAELLVIGEATVKTHVVRVLAKLDLRDRTQAAVRCYELGWVRAGESVEGGTG
jgi:DNA-binding NarL/FixJ family response regulator